jgi:general secretion pathway protein D
MTISILRMRRRPVHPARSIAGGSRAMRPLLFLLAMTLTWSAGYTQDTPQSGQTITPNFKDADLSLVIQAVQSITGKTFIIDPRVRAQVTILSSTPMDGDAFYQAFLSVLQVHDFVAVESGNIVKIVPAQNSRWMPGDDLPSHVDPNSDEIVTQVIAVKNVSAANLVPALRPLLPQGAHFVAHQSSNTLIISDRASNVNRMMRIIQRIDQAGDEDIDIIPLENASAAEIVRVVNSLYTAAGGAQSEPGAAAAKVVADDRTNSVLLSGEKSQRLRMKALITHLDTPLEAGGDTQVRYLLYADAEKLAAKLKEQITGIVQATPGAPPPTGGAAGSNGSADRGVSIWSDQQNNALIVTAPPKVMRSIMQVVDKLDIRRPQVLIEAILVEMNITKAAELGVNWAVGNTDSNSTVPIGTWNQAVGNASIGSIAAAIQNPGGAGGAAIPTGLTLGAGRFLDNGTNFAILLRALRNDGSSNILQTPSITTLDHQEAQIKVAQEVPFVTGQYTNTSGNNNGSVNPFQTIQREEVGTILKITPQINEGSSVTLKISQESSDLSPSATASAGAVDLITNKRTIDTTVMVDDGGVIVLGGLIRDAVIEGENRVPILGSIPLIGELFKTRSGSKEKRNLMVFIRPTILRDGVKAAIETNAKYNVLRNQQMKQRNGKVSLLPGEHQPLLPPIEDLSKYADPTAGAAPPAAGTDTQKDPPLETTPLPAAPPPTSEPVEPPPQQ